SHAQRGPPVQDAQQTQVAAVDGAQLGKAVHLSGHTGQSPPESETGKGVRVVTELLENISVHHSGAHDGDPAGVVARGTTAAAAQSAFHVDSDGGFGVRIGLRLQAYSPVAVEFPGEVDGHSLEVREGQSAVHPEAVELVEHGQVGGVHGLVPVDAAGHHDLDGAAGGPGEDTGLDAGGVGAQQALLVHPEGVLHVPGGVVAGDVE